MGLLRTAARTAVITGTATRVHGRVASRQQAQWAQQNAAPPQAAPLQAAPPQYAPGPPPPPAAPPARDTGAMISQLTELGKLRDAGVLTEAEFEVQKARVLHG
jgi:hypothetical protein